MFGVTFMVLGSRKRTGATSDDPGSKKPEVDAYLERTKKRTERERICRPPRNRRILRIRMPSILLRAKQCPSGSATMCWQDTEREPSWPYRHMTAATMPSPNTSDCPSFRWWKVAMSAKKVSMPRKASYATHQKPIQTPYCDLNLNGLTIKEAIASY